MENKTQPNIQPVQPLPQILTSVSPSTNWSKIILFSVLGFIVVAGSVFVGIQIGKNQIRNQQPTILPTQKVILPTEPSPLVLIAPSKEAKAIIPPDAFSETLKFELSETLTSANIPNYKSVITVALFGFTTNNQPVDMLDKEISMEYYVPKEFNSYDKTQNKWWTYDVENPTIFLYSKAFGWELLPSNWDKDSRILIVKTKQIGSFAVAIPQSSKRFLKE